MLVRIHVASNYIRGKKDQNFLVFAYLHVSDMLVQIVVKLQNLIDDYKDLGLLKNFLDA